MLTETVMIAMRDGVQLATDLYFPPGAQEGGRFPTILVRTTYDKTAARTAIDPDVAMATGYVVALQDVRGRGESGGSFYHGVAEAEDGHDTIEWLAAQAWSDGQVGMTGTSYLAAVQCAAACSGTSHLRSMFHVKGPIDYFRDCNRRSGKFPTYMLPVLFMFAATSQEANADERVKARLEEAFANGAAWLDRLPLKPSHSPLAATPGLERWLLDMQHEVDYSPYWTNVPLWQPCEFLDRYADVPGYYVGGWYDMYREEQFFPTLRGQGHGEVRLLMGPWSHLGFESVVGDVDFGPEAALWSRQYWDLQLRWFDHTLKGKATDVADEPPVKIFVMGGGDGRKTAEGRMRHGGRWRHERSWPLERTRYVEYYLQPDARLEPDAPAEDTSSCSTYIYDPRDPVPTVGGVDYFIDRRVPGQEPGTDRWGTFIPYGPHDQIQRYQRNGRAVAVPLAARQDVLVFQSPPLDAELEVTGPISARLWVSSSAPDTDFVVKLVDVYPPNEDYPAGYAMNVSEGRVRVRYRDLRNRAADLHPDEVVLCEIEMYAVSNLFARAHRVRLDITSSSFPAMAPNPNNGDEFLGSHPSVVAVNSVHHDSEHASCVVLPLIAPA